jgi:hypothetical protein
MADKLIDKSEVDDVIKSLNKLYLRLPIVLCAVGYFVIMIATGEIDFRRWNMLARTIYSLYVMVSIFGSWMAINNLIYDLKRKQQRGEK